MLMPFRMLVILAQSLFGLMQHRPHWLERLFTVVHWRREEIFTIIYSMVCILIVLKKIGVFVCNSYFSTFIEQTILIAISVS